MVSLDVNQVSIVSAVLGGFIVSFGLVSYVVKEKLFFSEALVSILVGIIFGPRAIDITDPSTYGDAEAVLHQFTRIVIAVQVMLAGVSLPKAYIRKEWKSLVVLLGPVMIWMWMISSLSIYALIPNITFLEALAIGSCVTPTDPVLSAGVLKGRFANKYVPPHVRNIILAESGANDGLGYPFLFLATNLILNQSPGKAISEWIYDVILYQIALSIVIGLVIGFIARKTLYHSEKNKWCDKESFLVYAIALALFTMGVTGMLGSDDLLACFFAGNSFTWDDWFRVETQDEALQDVIDMLLNLSIFVYIGAIVPWDIFSDASLGLTPWRLVIISVLILIFRRLPIIIALYRAIPAVVTFREALFAGWFGPIGVGALFYLTVAMETLSGDEYARLRGLFRAVVFFVVLSSVCVHGLTLPVYKLTEKGIQTTRELTQRTMSGDSNANIVARLPKLRFGQTLSFSRTDSSAQLGGSRIPTATESSGVGSNSGVATPTSHSHGLDNHPVAISTEAEANPNAPRPPRSRRNSLTRITFADEADTGDTSDADVAGERDAPTLTTGSSTVSSSGSTKDEGRDEAKDEAKGVVKRDLQTRDESDKNSADSLSADLRPGNKHRISYEEGDKEIFEDEDGLNVVVVNDLGNDDSPDNAASPDEDHGHMHSHCHGCMVCSTQPAATSSMNDESL